LRIAQCLVSDWQFLNESEAHGIKRDVVNRCFLAEAVWCGGPAEYRFAFHPIGIYFPSLSRIRLLDGKCADVREAPPDKPRRALSSLDSIFSPVAPSKRLGFSRKKHRV
jgi:hypothetical protein